jgi:hypothetical protein
LFARVGSTKGAQACAAEIVTTIIAINSKSPSIVVAPSITFIPKRSRHPSGVADHKGVTLKMDIRRTEGG